MAKTVVALEATINSSQAEGSVKSLKAQLREAQAEVAALSDKFGETSTQARAAATRAAELKDKIGDAKALTDAFNPDSKFKALSGALSVVAGGFAAVQGAMGLVGSDSKELEKTLLKVQSAMALATGLNQLGEAADAWKRLKATLLEYSLVQKVVTTAQRIWNAAMAANPIGAIVVAITALIAGVVALTSYFMSNAKAAKEQAKSVEESTKALEKQSKTLERNNSEFQKSQDYKLGLAKANGASTKSIRELESKLIDEKIAFELASRATAQNSYEKEKNKLATLKAADADDELIKKQLDNVKKAVEEYNKQNKNVQDAYDERTAINRKHNIEVAQENTAASDKAKEKRKQDNQQAVKDQEETNKQILDANKQLQEQRRALAQEEALKNIKDDDERAKKKLEFDYLRQKQEIEQSKASQSEKFQTLQLLYTTFLSDTQTIDEARKVKDAENATNELDTLIQNMEAQQQVDIQYAEAQKKLDEEVAKNKEEQLQRGAALLSNISSLVGKQTAAGKATAVAAATIDTYQAAWKAYKNAQENPISILGPAYPYIQAGLAVAGGIANIKKILAVQIPGGGGGGGSVPSGGGINVPTAPVAPSVATTTINQGQVNQLSSATARAFVLESDISGNQERIARLNRAARIN